jgi:pimeloyl-ACP methyl ester carboxylesterase
MADVFRSDDIAIAYSDDGPRDGDPVLLVHGFASNRDVNWRYPGWIDTLTGAGYRAIAIDNRGHGESEKLYDPARYPSPLMAEDAGRLLDHLAIGRAAVMGYSMGARIAAFLALSRPEKVSRLVFGGLGTGMVEGVGSPEPIVAALEAPSIADVTDRTGRAFRAFAEQTKSDLSALAACMRSARQRLTPEEVGKIAVPALVAVGERDDIAGSPEGLAALLPRGEALVIPRRDHMTAVGDTVFKDAVLAFLERTK